MEDLAIQRVLDENTRKQGIVIRGEVYSLHITHNDEVVITDFFDYSKIYAVMSLGFSNTAGFT